jgi:subtilisin family serine protease
MKLLRALARLPRCFALLCAAAAAPAWAAPQDAALAASPDRYIVAGIDNPRAAATARAGSSPRGYDGIRAYGASSQARQLLRAIENEYGLSEVSAWPIEPLHMHCAVLKIPDGADRAALLAALNHDPRVRLAQPLQTFRTRTQGYNDPYVGLQRGFRQMDVADAHAISRGAGVKVAVIDTGADLNHPDLRGRVARVVNVVDADSQQFNRDRHGTEILGVIAAVANNGEGIVGVAPNARVYLIKACWQLQSDADPARCNSFTLAQGLVAALDAGAQVVNLSLTGPADPLLRALIDEGSHRGVLFVGAAPADATDDGLLRGTGAIEVASVDSPRVDDARVYAPGSEILTLLPGGRYDFASGSSLATAHVTGAVALILASNPHVSAAAMQQLLRQSSERVAHADGSPVGGVDACAALVAAAGHGDCRSGEIHSERVAGAH